jgi:hypothetical protein
MEQAEREAEKKKSGEALHISKMTGGAVTASAESRRMRSI